MEQIFVVYEEKMRLGIHAVWLNDSKFGVDSAPIYHIHSIEKAHLFGIELQGTSKLGTCIDL